MGKSKPKVEVTQYRMSIHFGICHGIPDYISEVKIAEKSAWTGQQATQGSFIIAKPELFGGDKKEGGAVGEVHYFPGNGTQTVSDYLAGKLGLTEDTMPAYRGVASAWFTEYAGARENGFYWSANNPYLPTVWIKVAVPSLLLNEHEARIYRSAAASEPTWNVQIADEDLNASPVTDYANDINAGWVVKLNHAEDGDWEVFAWHSSDGFTERRWRTLTDSAAQSLCIDNLGHVLVSRQGEAFVDVYSLFNGDHQQTVTLLAAGPSNAMICCTTIGDKAYAFRWGTSVELLQGDADGYAYVNGQDVGNWLTLVNGVFLAPHAIYGVRDGFLGPHDGSIDYVPWTRDEDGDALLSAPSTINLDTTFGIGTNIRLIAYSAALDRNFVVMEQGRVHAFNADFTELLYSNAGNDGWEIAIVQSGGVASQYFMSPGVLAFFAMEDGSAQNLVVQYDASTLELIQSFNVSDDGGYVNGSNSAFTWGKIDSTLGAVLVGGSSGVEPPSLWSVPLQGEYDSNPAHVIFEALQNVEWGMGHPESGIDRASFEAAATVLYEERLGISLIWTKQSTIESLINEVLDHIEAVFFCSPRTGLLTLKLIRDDYTLSGLPVFTPDNCVVTNFARKLWGETINEVVVTFTNPTNEETETVVAQDLANIEVQGGPVSDSRNYYMLRVKEIAMKLAQRDLRKASTPLASCDIEANRSAWDLLPGDVLILNSPEDGIEMMVMRVGPVDYGKPGDSRVRAQLVEDIFSLPTAVYTIPPDTAWEDPAEEPTPADDTLILTLPYFFVVNLLPPEALSGLEHPEVFAGILASEEGQDTSEFELYGSITSTTGTVSQGQLGTKSIASHAELSDAIEPEVTTTFPAFSDRTQGAGPVVGGFIYLEGEDETDCEICLITGVTSTLVTAKRGVLDTVPRAWPAGTSVWFITEGQVIDDDEVRSEGETVSYKILIRTSLGLLSPAMAPTVSYTLTDRPWLPLRPADVMVNGDDGFSGVVDCIGVDPIPVTWARRNRETEDAVVLAWDAGDVSPETGQTTTVTLTDLTGTVLHTYSGIAGTSQNVDPADFAGEALGYIVLTSVRDGLSSLQGYAVLVQVEAGEGFIFEDEQLYGFEEADAKQFEDA